jgi:ABC-2 type transport system permease protein
MTSLRIFFIGGLMSFRALFGWLSPWILIPTYVVAPIFQICCSSTSAALQRCNPTSSTSSAMPSSTPRFPASFAMTHTIAGERYQNTLGAVLATPAKRVPLFLGRSLPVIANGFFVSGFAFAAGGAIVGIHVPARSIAPIALVIVVTSFACTGIGLATAGIGLLARDTATLDNIVFGILLVFCGVNVSLSDMPGWMSTIAQGLPLTHGIEAARKLADGAAFSHVGGSVAAEALVGLIYGLAGYTLIGTLERQSRIHATLERA